MKKKIMGVTAAFALVGALLLVAPTAANAATAGPDPTVTLECPAIVFSTPPSGNELDASGTIAVSVGTALGLQAVLRVQTEAGAFVSSPQVFGDTTSNVDFDLAVTGIPATSQAQPVVIVTWKNPSAPDDEDLVSCRYSADTVIPNPTTPPAPREPDHVGLDVENGIMPNEFATNQAPVIGGVTVFLLAGLIVAFGLVTYRRRAADKA